MGFHWGLQKKAAKEMDFLEAARLRDEMFKLEAAIKGL